MRKILKLLFVVLLAGGMIFLLGAFQIGTKKLPENTINLPLTDGGQTGCHQTEHGPVIDWRSDYKLKYKDFKKASKGSPGFAVATTSSAFGYSITDRDGEISGSIYVRFYCKESWWSPDIRLDEVLDHEQLHFDICELFGRKLYKEVLTLRDNGKLSSRSIKHIETKLEKQYDAYQDLYDSETNHSTNGDAQREWNQKIKRELEELSDYANYQHF